MQMLFFPFQDRFFYLLLLPLAFLFLLLLFWNRELFLRKYPNAVVENRTFIERLFSPVLLFLSMAFVLLAALEPMGAKLSFTQQTRENTPVIATFVIDSSASMGAKDVLQGDTRFAAALDWVNQYLQYDKGSFYSLYLLGGQLDKWVHKSFDKTLMQIYLRSLFSYTPSGPTLFSSLFYSIGGSDAKDSIQVVYLLTDGEDSSSTLQSEAFSSWQSSLKSKGIFLIPIGVGSIKGADISVEGETVHTALDESNIKKFATEPELYFTLSTSPERVQEQVYSALPLKESVAGQVDVHFAKPLYLVPLFIGLFLLFLSLYLPVLGSPYPLLCFLLFFTPSLQAENFQKKAWDSLRVENFSLAENLLRRSLQENRRGESAITLYNLAAAEIGQGKYARAFLWLSYIDLEKVPVWFRYAILQNMLLAKLHSSPSTIHTKIRVFVLSQKFDQTFAELSPFERNEYLEDYLLLKKKVEKFLDGHRYTLDQVKALLVLQRKQASFKELLKQLVEEQQVRTDLSFYSPDILPADMGALIQEMNVKMREQYKTTCAFSPWSAVVLALDKAQKAKSTYTFISPAEHLTYTHYLQEALAALDKSLTPPCGKETDSALQIIRQMEQDDLQYKQKTTPLPPGAKPW